MFQFHLRPFGAIRVLVDWTMMPQSQVDPHNGIPDNIHLNRWVFLSPLPVDCGNEEKV